MDERLHDGVAGLEDRHRSADRIRLGRLHRIGESAQIIVVVGIALRQRLDANQPVLGFPAVHQFRRQRLQRDRAGLHRVPELIEHDLERGDEDVLRLVARRLVAAGKFRQRVRQST